MSCVQIPIPVFSSGVKFVVKLTPHGPANAVLLCAPIHPQGPCRRDAYAVSAVSGCTPDQRCHSRVAPGGYPPGAPTDPDVPDSGIRLLSLRARPVAVDTVNDARGNEGVAAEEAPKRRPLQVGLP
jgi:hypothetical protein